jgi:hypothetical protein
VECLPEERVAGSGEGGRRFVPYLGGFLDFH